jgi:hypothetical protein
VDRETFLSYRGYLWLWICVLSLTVLWGVYLVDNPLGGPNGGTVLGYTYGGIATAGILYLMYYGIRKRSFYAKVSTLKGTLSAHVWIGITLIFIVPLHSGFSFGLNVHTLAYVLMLITIFSGIWGVVMYERLPLDIRSQRGGGTMRVLLEQINALSADIVRLAGVDPASKSSSPKSDAFLGMLQKIDFSYSPSLFRSLRATNPKAIDPKQAAGLMSSLAPAEQEDALKLIALVNRKRELVCRTQDEARALTWVRLWLFIHLPVSFGLVVALAVHIFSVFYYW